MKPLPIHRRRRGSVYLMVLGATLFVATLSVLSLTLLRLGSRTRSQSTDRFQAEALARAAVEKARLMIKTDKNWRTNQTNGVWWSQTVSGISASVQVVDPLDGDLADSPDESVRITGQATFGSARQKVSVDLYPVFTPIDALTYGLHVAGPVSVTSGSRIDTTVGPISANGTVTNSGIINATMYGLAYVSSGGSIPGSFITRTTPIDAVDSTTMSWYETRGTVIPFTGNLSKICLTNTHNPWGQANGDGLYVINTGGSDIKIENSRVSGTLVVRCGSPTAKVRLHGALLMYATRIDFPTLITDGELHIEIESLSSNLSEAEQGTNFNPTGASYNGSADSDTADFYPSEITGVVYTTSKLYVGGNSRIVGTVIAGGTGTHVLDGDSMWYNYDDRVQIIPPIGFRNYKMKISQGTWQRRVD